MTQWDALFWFENQTRSLFLHELYQHVTPRHRGGQSQPGASEIPSPRHVPSAVARSEPPNRPHFSQAFSLLLVGTALRLRYNAKLEEGQWWLQQYHAVLPHSRVQSSCHEAHRRQSLGPQNPYPPGNPGVARSRSHRLGHAHLPRL